MDVRRRRGRAPRRDEIAVLVGDRVVRVATLEALGIDRATIAYRCRPGGPWSRLGPGVVKLDNGPQTREDRCRAALLHAGPGAVITGVDALARHGVRSAPVPSGPVHVLIPAGRRRIGAGLMLAERTHRLPPGTRSVVPLAPVARAALDAARRTRDRNLVRTLFADLVQHGHCTVDDLLSELVHGSNRGSALPREVLREIVDGVRSVAEAAAHRLVRRSGLPAPLLNVRLESPDGAFIAVPDLWFDDVGLAWQIDSRQYHLDPADYDRTVRVRSALITAGVVVVQSLPGDVGSRPGEVLAELRQAYAQAARLPRPSVTVVRQEPAAVEATGATPS